ncbi:MAG: type IV toxin-antitoxin system AbiEi family antitoxin domain-containing protein, partial [Pseudonocardiaceae bacterium]
MTVAVTGLPPTFTTRTARSFGLHPRDLYRLRDEGELLELSRGVFRRADAPAPTLPDLLAVSYRTPVGVVCCISALIVHDLTDEIPTAVQIAVPRQNRPPRISHPPTEVFRFATATFELGLSTVAAAPGERIRIYSAERTVVDLMRLRHRLGEPLALGALRRYLRR